MVQGVGLGFSVYGFGLRVSKSRAFQAYTGE